MTRPGSGILSLMFRRGMKATGLSCSVASLGREILDLALIGRMGLEMLGVGLAVRVVVEEAKVLVGCCRMLLLLPNLSAMVATRLNHYDKTMGRKKKKKKKKISERKELTMRIRIPWPATHYRQLMS